MTADTAGTREPLLVLGVLAAPVGWFATFVAGYVLAEGGGPRWAMLLTIGIGLVFVVVSGIVGLRTRARLRARSSPHSEHDAHDWFLAQSALRMSAIFFLVIVAQVLFVLLAPRPSP
jgi:hypothetical protein